jgi:NAD+ synthase
VPARARPRPRKVEFNLPDEAARWEATITAFIARHVEAAGAKGVVLGMSGGLDSAVVGALAVRALGKRKVLCVMMPTPDSDPKDEKDARLACKALGVTPVLRPIGPLLEGFEKSLAGKPDKAVKGNAKARSRMMVLYAEGQPRNYLVCGTGNKSELLTGYFTKHGDGGVDLQPIGDLYKTQVRQLATFLGVPKALVEKPPSAGLYSGQTDEKEMGLTYEQLDAILRGMELNHSHGAIVRKTGLPLSMVEKVERMVRRTEHKRRLPLVPKIGARTVGIDWRRPVHWDA